MYFIRGVSHWLSMRAVVLRRPVEQHLLTYLLNPNFSNLLKRIVDRFKRAGYSLDIMRQTACLVFNPIMVEGYAALFSCTAVIQASDSMTASM